MGLRIYGPVSGLPHGDPRMHVLWFWAHFRFFFFQFVVNFRVWGVGFISRRFWVARSVFSRCVTSTCASC